MKVRFELGLGKQYDRDDVAWLVEAFGLRITDVWDREVSVLVRGRDGRCARDRADDVMSDLVPSATARYQGEFFLPLHIEIGDIIVEGFEGPARFIIEEGSTSSRSTFEGKTIASLSRVLAEARRELVSVPEDAEGLAAFVSALEHAQRLGMAVHVRL
jgi:hypothetical protein